MHERQDLSLTFGLLMCLKLCPRYKTRVCISPRVKISLLVFCAMACNSVFEATLTLVAIFFIIFFYSEERTYIRGQHANAYLHTRTHTDTKTKQNKRVYTYRDTHSQTNTHRQIHIHIQIHTYAHTTHTHTETHTLTRTH